MLIIKDKYYFYAIFFGTIEKILIFLLFIFPLRAINSVIENSVGRKLDLVFNFLGITVNNQTELTSIFAITFISLLICLFIVNRVKSFIIQGIKNSKRKYKKKSTLEENLKKLKDVDHHIDIRIYTAYGSILFIFLIFYDLPIASLIILGGCISYFQYRRLEKFIQKDSILEINNDRYSKNEKKYQKLFTKNKLITKYRESKLIIKASTNTITMMSIMYVIFFREDKSSISIIFIFLTRLLLNQVDQIISRYQRNKYDKYKLIE